MKKSLAFILGVMGTCPGMAAIHISSDVVHSTIVSHVPADYQVAAMERYNALVKDNGDNGVPETGLWSVCTAAGWDIKNPDDKSKCQNFVNALVSAASRYYAVCGDDKGKSGGIEHCIDDVFTRNCVPGFCSSSVSGVKVQVSMREAPALAQLYARRAFNDNGIRCRGTSTSCGINDDCIQCVSSDGKRFYEFMFDDLKVNADAIIQAGVQTGVCKIHNVNATPSGCAGGGTNVNSSAMCWSATCAAPSATVCSQINESMSEFGFATKWTNNTCEIDFQSINSRDKLRTAFGLDNMMFCNGMQSHMGQTLDDYIKQIVSQNVAVTSFSCNKSKNLYYGGDCTKKKGNYRDDILTCEINGMPVDFVFDDLSEWSDRRDNAAVQALDCMVSGGTYDGKRCRDLSESECNKLKTLNLATCPECNSVRWEPNTKTCLLPTARNVSSTDQVVEIGAVAGLSAVGAVVAIVGAPASAAAAAAVGIAKGVVYALVAIDIAGSAIEIGGDIAARSAAKAFLNETEGCNSPDCAERLLGESFQRMANLINDMQDAQIRAVDARLAKLARLTPDDSVLWTTVLANGVSMADSQLSVWDINSWEPEQIWRAVGIGLQLTALIGEAGIWLAGRAHQVVPKLTESAQAIGEKLSGLSRADDIADLSKADEALSIPAGRFAATSDVISTLSDLENAKQKLLNLGGGISDFDAHMRAVVNGNAPFPGHYTRSTLTDTEFDALVAWFKNQYDADLVVGDYGMLDLARKANPTDPVQMARARMRAKLSGGGSTPVPSSGVVPTDPDGRRQALMSKLLGNSASSKPAVSTVGTPVPDVPSSTPTTGFRVAEDGTIIRL